VGKVKTMPQTLQFLTGGRPPRIPDFSFAFLTIVAASLAALFGAEFVSFMIGNFLSRALRAGIAFQCESCAIASFAFRFDAPTAGAPWLFQP
jgi:hypothetical protein